MSYVMKQNPFMVIGTVTVSDLTSAAVAQRYIATAKVIVKRVAVSIQTATVSNVSIVITPRKRPTPNSSASQSSGSTITVPTAIAAGSVYYKDLATPLTFQPGEELAFEVTTAAGGGGAAGAGWCFPCQVEESPEVPLNLTNHVASA